MGFVSLMLGVVGLGMVFDPPSTPLVRGAGAFVALVFGAGAWLLLREAIAPSVRLLLGPAGLRLASPVAESRFDLGWSELGDVRVEGAGEAARVVLASLDGPASDPSRLVLPRFHGWRPDDVVAEIERLRRAYRHRPPSVRREDMM